MKITGIKRNEHGLADLSYVPLVFAAPKLAGFENNKEAALICRAFSVSALAYSLCTDAKWGAIKLIPYKVHAGLDVASGVLAFGASLIPQIAKNKAARNTFIVMGLTGLLVGTLSLIGAKRTAF
jgi:hypothetical protein